ncbi:MAG: DUF2516 family protein [Ruaniaceae bacterium]|nr:DUF2516 family protein [Ruaniaceae bacterium]
MELYNVLNFWLNVAVSVTVFAIEIVAFLDSLSHSTHRYEAEFKWKKTNWVALLGAMALFGFLAIPLWPFSFSFGLFFTMLMVTPAGVYLADVRPALRTS